MIRALAFALAISAAPVFAETVTIETYTGAVDVAIGPGKIAVLDIAALDTLDALGVKVDGVVAPLFVDYVADAVAGAENVGSLFEPDFEALAAGGYDLLIAGGRSSKVAPDLAKIAPTIDMTIWEDTVGQGLARLEAYGKIFGKEAEAAQLAQDFNETLTRTVASLEGEGGTLIVMTNGPKVSAYGSGGRFGWLHNALGLAEAITDVEQTTHGEAISFEFIRDTDPDVLVVIDRLAAIGRDGEGAKATLDNALVQETKAWRNGKVIYLDSAAIYIAGGGIQAMTLTLEQFIQTFAGG